MNLNNPSNYLGRKGTLTLPLSLPTDSCRSFGTRSPLLFRPKRKTEEPGHGHKDDHEDETYSTNVVPQAIQELFEVEQEVVKSFTGNWLPVLTPSATL